MRTSGEEMDNVGLLHVMYMLDGRALRSAGATCFAWRRLFFTTTQDPIIAARVAHPDAPFAPSAPRPLPLMLNGGIDLTASLVHSAHIQPVLSDSDDDGDAPVVPLQAMHAQQQLQPVAGIHVQQQGAVPLFVTALQVLQANNAAEAGQDV